MQNLIDKKADIISFYNSEEYDAFRGQANQEKKAFLRLFEEMVLCLPQDAQVLDWGCGNAQVIHRFLPKSGTAYLGVDFSYRQIEIAVQKNPEHRYLLADFIHYPFSQNRYDLILLRNSFQQVASSLRESVIVRAHASLKEGGRLLIEQAMKDIQKEPHCLPILELESCLAFFKKSDWEIEEQLHDHRTKTWIIIAKK